MIVLARSPQCKTLPDEVPEDDNRYYDDYFFFWQQHGNILTCFVTLTLTF